MVIKVIPGYLICVHALMISVQCILKLSWCMITKVISGYFIGVYYKLMISVHCFLKISHKLNNYKSDIRLCNKYLCTNDISTVYLEAIFSYDYKCDIGLLYKCVCTNDIRTVDSGSYLIM